MIRSARRAAGAIAVLAMLLAALACQAQPTPPAVEPATTAPTAPTVAASPVVPTVAVTAAAPTVTASPPTAASVATLAASPTSPPVATATAAARGEIQFAWAGPLTGDAAQLGQGLLNGTLLATEEWNARGGLLNSTIVIEPEDDQCDPKQAALVAAKIADDPKNVLLFGHACSGATLASAPIVNKVGLPMITPSTNPTITQQGWNTLFRAQANDTVQGKVGITYVTRTLGLKTFAILHDNQAFGVGVGEVEKQTIEAAGGTVTSTGGVDPKEVDYSAVITKIVQVEKPQAVLYCTGAPSSAGQMIKQLRQLGFAGTIIGCDGWFDPGAIEGAEGLADRVSDTEAVYITFQTPPYDATPALEAFAAKYAARFGRQPNAYEAYGYDVANLAFAAVEKAGVADRAAIANALRSNVLPGLLNERYQFDAQGELATWTFYVYRVEQGEFRLVDTISG